MKKTITNFFQETENIKDIIKNYNGNMNYQFNHHIKYVSMLRYLPHQLLRKICSKIKLIEPSSLALNRAKKVLQYYSPNTKIVDINKKLDDLDTKDLETNKNLGKIHLFSNILDIDGFDIAKLFNS